MDNDTNKPKLLFCLKQSENPLTMKKSNAMMIPKNAIHPKSDITAVRMRSV